MSAQTKKRAEPNPADIPDHVIRDFARTVLKTVTDLMQRPGQMDHYKAWYRAQMAAGNPLALTPEDFYREEQAR